jgi:hypothetical protein
MLKCCCGTPSTSCLVHNIYTSFNGFSFPFGEQPVTKTVFPKIAPSFELFVFEDRHGAVKARVSMQEEVGCPVELTAVESLALVRLMRSISSRCEKWSERSMTRVLP